MKNCIGMSCLWLGVAFILTVFFEYVFHKWVLLMVTGGAGGAGVIINMLEKAVESFCDSLFGGGKADTDKSGKEEEMGGWFKRVKAFFQQARSKRGLRITAFVMTACLLAGILVRFDACEQAVKFCQGGYAALTDSSDAAGDMVAMGVSVVASRGEDMLPPEQPDVTVTVEAKRYLTGSDERLIQQLDNSSITWEDIHQVLNLSEEDYNILFFLEGLDSGIYESQDQLNQRVLDSVQLHTAAKLKNIFDLPQSEGGPSQEILNMISRLSDLERETIDFAKTKDILISREGVYQLYPKRTLAQLVSNGYHKLALLLFWHGGEEATIIYFYGQSILSGMECLKFADNTSLTVKEKLLFIAQRYEDIAYTCPGFRDAQRARMLAEAFRYAADQY